MSSKKVYFSNKRYSVITDDYYSRFILENNKREFSHRKSGPAFYGIKFYYYEWIYKNLSHRIDGPAYIDHYSKYWCFKNTSLYEDVYWNQ